MYLGQYRGVHSAKVAISQRIKYRTMYYWKNKIKTMLINMQLKPRHFVCICYFSLIMELMNIGRSAETPRKYSN